MNFSNESSRRAHKTAYAIYTHAKSLGDLDFDVEDIISIWKSDMKRAGEDISQDLRVLKVHGPEVEDLLQGLVDEADYSLSARRHQAVCESQNRRPAIRRRFIRESEEDSLSVRTVSSFSGLRSLMPNIAANGKTCIDRYLQDGPILVITVKNEKLAWHQITGIIDADDTPVSDNQFIRMYGLPAYKQLKSAIKDSFPERPQWR